jgi:adenylate cyclase
VSPAIRRRLLAIPLLALTSLLLTLGLRAINEQLEEAQRRSPLGGLNRGINDLAFQRRNATNQDSLWALNDVVVIDIDDASIRELGRIQLWPRAFTARVLEHVSAGDPAAVGLDVLYTEPDTLSGHYARLLDAAGLEQTDRILAAMSTDDKLASALRRADNAYLGLYDETEKSPPDQGEPLYEALRVVRDSSALAHRMSSLTHPVLPIPSFRRAARGIAPILLPTSADGVVRRYPVAQRLPVGSASTARTALVPSFSLLMAADLLETPVSSMEFGEQSVRLGAKRTIPVDPSGHFRINWLGDDESIRRISYYKVLRQTVPAAFFEDKAVFLGGSAKGLEDLKATPVSGAGQKPGVLVHAEAFLNVMNRAYLSEWTLADLWPWLLGGALPLLGIILAIPPLYATLLTLLLAAVQFFGYLLYLFPAFGIVLPMGTILAYLLIVLIGGVVFKYVTEEWAKQKLRDAFATYVPASVVDRVTEQPDTLGLGGEKKQATVLFCDIRGFTTYSEHLDPQEVVAFLNRFFDRMTAAVFEHDGTVDKFIGDEMMAIFGAPLAQEDHAARACAAAIAMAEGLDALNREQNLGGDGAAPSEMAVSVGVGINTGEVVAGNIGSSQRFEYTVVGDAVNLAARLQGLTRRLGVDTLVGSATYQAVSSERWAFRKLGAFRVKGREEPEPIYELLDPDTYPDPEALRATFEEGLDLYHQRQFSAAKIAFEDCQSMFPDDGPSAYYIRLCEDCEEDSGRYDSVLDAR